MSRPESKKRKTGNCFSSSPGTISIFVFADIGESIGSKPLPRSISSFVWPMPDLGAESLRDIETCLNSQRDKLYRIGFRGAVSRKTLADANERRDCRIFEDFGRVLIGIAQELCRDEPVAVELKQPLYAFNSTTIGLCLSFAVANALKQFPESAAAINQLTLFNN